MSLPHLSASSSSTPEIPTLRVLPPPLRAEQLDAELAGQICEIIRIEGVADHHAGALLGVPQALFARWKAEDEGFALKLEEARAWFEIGLIREIKKARKSNGVPDWRAQAWLLTHATADGFAKPARATTGRAAKEASAAQKRAILPETQAAPTTASREDAANRPETAAPSGQAATPLASRIAPAGEMTSIRPETRQKAA
jgi:hypothetical protein